MIIVFHSDPSITAVIARILRAASYQVIQPAGISDVALALQRAERVDAIVIDPGDEPYFLGLVACRTARVMYPSLPVVLIADYHDGPADPSVSAVLQMPIRAKVLLETLGSLVGPGCAGAGPTRPCE